MPSQLLTDVSIRSLKKADKQYDVWDSKVRGLLIRVSPGETKTFCFAYRVGGQKRRMTIGRWPTPMSLADARERAKTALRAVEDGHDPAVLKQLTRAEYTGKLFGAVVSDFIEGHAKVHTRQWWETERILKKEFKTWDKWPISVIKRQDVTKVLKEIVARGKPTAANAALSAVRKLFNWAVDEGYLQTSPCQKVKKPTKVKSRNRVLSDTELAKVWLAADEMGWPFGRIVQLLILTGQRKQEVTGLRWTELAAVKEAVWSIPPDRTKADRPHDLPLSKLISQILEDLPQVHEELAFPANSVHLTRRAARHKGNGALRPVSGFSKWKQDLDDLAGVHDWRLHDLRRTLATGMASLKVPPHIVERVQNRKTGILGGVTGVYNRFGYTDEMQEALEKWAEHVTRTVEAEERGAQAESRKTGTG